SCVNLKPRPTNRSTPSPMSFGRRENTCGRRWRIEQSQESRDKSQGPEDYLAQAAGLGTRPKKAIGPAGRQFETEERTGDLQPQLRTKDQENRPVRNTALR